MRDPRALPRHWETTFCYFDFCLQVVIEFQSLLICWIGTSSSYAWKSSAQKLGVAGQHACPPAGPMLSPKFLQPPLEIISKESTSLANRQWKKRTKLQVPCKEDGHKAKVLCLQIKALHGDSPQPPTQWIFSSVAQNRALWPEDRV